jgi:hypothetical protein
MAGHDTPFYPSFTSKGLDTGTGNRNLDLGALYQEQMSKKKLKGIEVPKTYEDLIKLYGSQENIPTPLKSSLGTLQFDIPEGKEIKKIDGKDVLVDKDRPKNFARFVAGLKDVMSGFTTDYDKLGGQYVDDGTGKEVYNPLGTLEEFDKTDLSNIKLSPTQLANIEKQVVDEFGEVPSPTEGIQEYLKGMELVRKQEDEAQIRKARRIGLEAFGNYALTEPVRQMFLNKAAEDAQNRYIRGRFALEATPTKIQDIMTAKQAQQGIAALSEAERAKAVAEQQKAANEFGAPQVTLARNVRFANASFKA